MRPSLVSACLVIALALVMASQVAPASAAVPALKALVDVRAVQKMEDTFLPLVFPMLQNLHVPDVDGRAAGFNYWLTTIFVESVSYQFATSSVEPWGVALSISGISAHMTLNWRYRLAPWPHIPRGSGSADIHISGASALVRAQLTQINGHPHLAVEDAEMSLKNIDIKVHGSAFSWLYDLILVIARGAIRKQAEAAIGKAMRNEIDWHLNTALATFPMQRKLSANMQIDYSMTADAKTSPAHVLSIPDRCELMALPTPAVPCPMPHVALPDFSVSTGHMVDALVDPFVFNSALYTFYTQKFFDRVVEDSMLPPDVPLRLNTSTFSEMIPPLYQQYPDMLMQFRLTAQQSPVIVVEKDDALATLKFDVWAYVQTAPTTFVPVFLLDLAVRAGAVPLSAFTNTEARVSANLTFVDISSALKESKIGDFDVSELNELLAYVGSGVALPKANEVLNKGFDLPVLDGMHFTNDVVKLEQQYLHVAFDLQYVPPQAHMNAYMARLNSANAATMLRRAQPPPNFEDEQENGVRVDDSPM